MKKKAAEITGHPMQYFNQCEDIEWVLDVHVQPNQGFTKDNTDGVIFIGHHEDSPSEIWLTRPVDRKADLPANHIEAIYTLVRLKE
jgi:hypothetical protein